ncbi:unnamed protein product [Brassica rapa]|uniref:RIN4 pathogenic type III effector avirulence factor Avr cleavage site domain-containing protein n=1 Tax=Brassica campestris TaxID=3711 RepID=A0A8D9GMK3_BRACM|nr:unnamed protein product [Brassica rapa]
MVSNVRIDFVTYAVVKQRIYTLSPRAWCHAYDPRERTLETWAGGHELRGLWQASSCVVDGMLFNVDPGRSLGHLILVFDLKKQLWKPVKLKGAHGLPPCVYQYGYESRMGSVGGKLVILVGNQTQWWDYEGEKSIWCVEIGLRRRQGGEIRGKVESVDVVFKTTKSTPSIELSRTVIDKGRPLPKFGEWDVNDPSSAEGFTVIFNKARNEKKGGGVSDSPRKDEHAGFNKNGHVLGKPTVSDSISSLNSRKVKIVERIAELY